MDQSWIAMTHRTMNGGDKWDPKKNYQSMQNQNETSVRTEPHMKSASGSHECPKKKGIMSLEKKLRTSMACESTEIKEVCVIAIERCTENMGIAVSHTFSTRGCQGRPQGLLKCWSAKSSYQSHDCVKMWYERKIAMMQNACPRQN